jgi:ketosteroid isomerase-like protein
MITQEIANRLVELCQKGEYETCYAELYSPDIISHEDKSFGGETTVGIPAIKEKGKKWHDAILEMHSGFTNSAIVAGNSFACTMGFDASMKDGSRMNMAEVAVYKVANGKIVEEWFFV